MCLKRKISLPRIFILASLSIINNKEIKLINNNAGIKVFMIVRKSFLPLYLDLSFWYESFIEDWEIEGLR
jgi:hypothetical protein